MDTTILQLFLFLAIFYLEIWLFRAETLCVHSAWHIGTEHKDLERRFLGYIDAASLVKIN